MEPTDISSYENKNESTINQQPYQEPLMKSSMLTIAAMIIMISGVLIAFSWIYIMTSPDFIDTMMESGIYTNMNFTRDDILTALNVCGSIVLILSAFTFLGGILAFKRKMFWFAFLGGVIGIFALAPLLFFIPNVLSLIGTIFVLKSRREFHNTI